MNHKNHHPKHSQIEYIQARAGHYIEHKTTPFDAELDKLSASDFERYKEMGILKLERDRRRGQILGPLWLAAILGGFAWWGASTQWWGFANAHTTATPAPSVQQVNGTLCNDGWISHSTGRGTCSHHGGEAH